MNKSLCVAQIVGVISKQSDKYFLSESNNVHRRWDADARESEALGYIRENCDGLYVMTEAGEELVREEASRDIPKLIFDPNS